MHGRKLSLNYIELQPLGLKLDRLRIGRHCEWKALGRDSVRLA